MIFTFRLKLNYCYHSLIGLKVSVSTETKTRFLKFIDTFDLGYQPMVLGHVQTGFLYSFPHWLVVPGYHNQKKENSFDWNYSNFFLKNWFLPSKDFSATSHGWLGKSSTPQPRSVPNIFICWIQACHAPYI